MEGRGKRRSRISRKPHPITLVVLASLLLNLSIATTWTWRMLRAQNDTKADITGSSARPPPLVHHGGLVAQSKRGFCVLCRPGCSRRVLLHWKPQ
jgi:hypothetical protein